MYIGRQAHTCKVHLRYFYKELGSLMGFMGAHEAHCSIETTEDLFLVLFDDGGIFWSFGTLASTLGLLSPIAVKKLCSRKVKEGVCVRNKKYEKTLSIRGEFFVTL